MIRLSREFYERNTILVARDLLGKILVHRDGEKLYRGKIVETEAYINTKDEGAHFNKGLTNRTKVINESGGHIYIYNIYGMYQLFNIVTEKEGIYGAVLVRALEPLDGIQYMYENRYKKFMTTTTCKEVANLTNGPAKLVKAMNLSIENHYGADLVTDSRIWLEEGSIIPKKDIMRSKRINIEYAVNGRDYLLRFFIKDNRNVTNLSSSQRLRLNERGINGF